MTAADTFVLGLILGTSLVASGVFLGVWLGDRRVAQRRRLAALRSAAPPNVCGGADDPGETPEERRNRDPDWWKDA